MIVDPDQRTRFADKQVGEIWVRSSGRPHSYWQKPLESRETFHASLGDSNDGPFLRTGDLGFMDGQELFVTGRLKDLIIVRGINYYPQDIEQTVQFSHPALQPGCGAACSMERDGSEQVVIIQELQRTSRNAPTEEIIQAICRAVAEQHDLRVSAVLLLRPGQILKTSSGKIRRAACCDGFLDGTLQGIARWEQPLEPLTSSQPSGIAEADQARSREQIEAFLCRRMAALLNVAIEEIDPADTFARYGLDSVGAASLAADLTTKLGWDVSITLFYDFPSAHDLAQHLADKLKKDA